MQTNKYHAKKVGVLISGHLASSGLKSANNQAHLLILAIRRRFLRVLLAKLPDMWEPTFFGQYLFVCIIKSTYQVDVPGPKSWDLEAITGP